MDDSKPKNYVEYKRSKKAEPTIVLDYAEIKDIEVDGINTKDAPDFVDAYISSATYKGRDMTEEELDVLNEDSDFVHDKVYDHLY